MQAQYVPKSHCHNLCLSVHWLLFQKHKYQVAIYWYDHVPSKTIEEYGKTRIFLDHNFHIDTVIHDRGPDIIVQDKGTKNCHTIDVVIPKLQSNLIWKLKCKIV